MSDFMLEPIVKAETQLQALVERQRQILRGERGASALEYIGMVLVAALVVAAVVGAVKGVDLQGKVTGLINNILAGTAPA